ncbi:putative amidohydrolase [Pullulanibacillus pueri]|uniref:CN hydrolase domain-containing protein n=1 Tax=Pullulanibacillus pueri TaxID=1437324 RepID=A0A8J2ZVG0_9BACL|nr:hypothetical protein [Pullulanibacillus pueri]MBM7680929.1 putative amidohydrolase [Pullulanibacillus pueri]GGH81374.1 hypothetical protein GCM10007096_19180 [Pullulanibacillus pueri]
MRILIAQPKREQELEQLEHEILHHPDTDIIVFPEGYFKEEKRERICSLAHQYNLYVVAGYKDHNDKDRAFIVNRAGELILERAKTPEKERLYSPSKVVDRDVKIAYLLCREVFLGLEGLDQAQSVDLIFNPIGVGMFSEEQFSDWTNEAKQIAITQKALVIGVSHADGSYRNCGYSIPIAYCFDEKGEEVFSAKNDTRTRILDTETRKTWILDHSLI